MTNHGVRVKHNGDVFTVDRVFLGTVRKHADGASSYYYDAVTADGRLVIGSTRHRADAVLALVNSQEASQNTEVDTAK